MIGSPISTLVEQHATIGHAARHLTGALQAAAASNPVVTLTALPGNPNRGGALVYGGTDRFDFRGFRVLRWYLR